MSDSIVNGVDGLAEPLAVAVAAPFVLLAEVFVVSRGSHGARDLLYEGEYRKPKGTLQRVGRLLVESHKVQTGRKAGKGGDEYKAYIQTLKEWHLGY